jgi:hypothetical protein
MSSLRTTHAVSPTLSLTPANPQATFLIGIGH